MKTRIKYNPDILLRAAELYFPDATQEIPASEFACTNISKIAWDGGLDFFSHPIERDLFANVFSVNNRTFCCHYQDMIGRDAYKKKSTPEINEDIKEARILALCLAAEIARLYNNKKGGKF